MRFDDHECLCPWMIVSESEMNEGLMAIRRQFRKPFRSAARQREGWRTRWRIHNADIFHIDAAFETCADSLAESFLCSEALGVGSRDSEWPAARLGALYLCEDPVFKPLAITLERILDPLDIAQVRAKPDDHDPPREIMAASKNTIIQCNMT